MVRKKPEWTSLKQGRKMYFLLHTVSFTSPLPHAFPNLLSFESFKVSNIIHACVEYSPSQLPVKKTFCLG